MKRLLALTLFLSLALLAVGLLLRPAPEATPTPVVQPTAATFAHDPRVNQVLADLGVPGDVYYHIQVIITDQVVCNNPEARACAPGKTIYLRDYLQRSSVEQHRILGHEYLHIVWAETPHPEFIAEFDALYAASPAMQYRMSSYAKLSRPEFVNELHSVIGTEVADYKLSPALLAHYKQFLPGRDWLPSNF